MERRKFPRLNLSNELFKLELNGKVFSVADLSDEGMALRIIELDDLQLFPIAREMAGILNLRGDKLEVRVRVRNVRRDRIGFEFLSLSDEGKSAIGEFLDPKRLATQMKPVPCEEEGVEWYKSASGVDLLIWKDPENGFARFSLFILGTFILWESPQGLGTGGIAACADEESINSGVIRLETMILDPDFKPDTGKILIARTLIEHSNLADQLKAWLLECMD